MPVVCPRKLAFGTTFGIFSIISGLSLPAPGIAESRAESLSPFVHSLAIASAADEAAADFYRDTAYTAIWTDPDDLARREVFLTTLSRAGDHGLPVARYDAQDLIDGFRSALTEGDRGRLEFRMTQAFLDYARDLQSGSLVPTEVDNGIKRDVAVIDRRANLDAFLAASPADFLAGLVPQSAEYTQLMKAKMTLDRQVQVGGWGPVVAAEVLTRGDSGDIVVALRDRLIAMGYLRQSATREYDARIEAAVQAFQLDHGLDPDGEADVATLAEINIGPETRAASVVVALERQRWLTGPRGKRHIWVNLTDFTAKIVDDGKVTFATRSVVGKNVPDQRTPEFSDTMDFMVINPSWSVPRSITVKEYLPMMQRNPNAAGHLQLIDRNGRAVSRGNINFAAYTPGNFPYAMRQPPSDGNALGLVKFMFPNEYNIYLHDTPTKSLFANEVRAYSHGCIRLADPFAFAYALLSRQTVDPSTEFKSHLDTGNETRVDLAQPVPVHLVYFTAFPSAKGRMNYRRDVYGRDGRILDALIEAGVELQGVQG